jgi:hypothetical protein
LAAAIDDRMPGLPIISVARDGNPIELIAKLMHVGVRELLTAPVTHQLARYPAPVHLGDLYAFLPRSLASASTIAVSTHIRTLLLDCDLMAGVTKFLLKLGNSSSIVNALEHADVLDEDLWSQMVGHWDGLEVLHAGELAPPATLTSASLEVVLEFARGLLRHDMRRCGQQPGSVHDSDLARSAAHFHGHHA